jgi:hypothetical protein
MRKVLLICLILNSCSEKEDTKIYSNACAECIKYSYQEKMIVDSCGSIESVNKFVLEKQRLGFDCRTEFTK